MRRSYLGLDLVRFAAALMVAAYHLGFWWWLPINGDHLNYRQGLQPLAPFVSSGWVGVQIFFVISGFVIAFSAERKSAPKFIVDRALRLYPAAWICSSITFLLVAPDFLAYFRSMILWPIGPWVSSVYWTLAVEIVFYSVIAIALALGGSKILVRVGLALGVYSCAFWGLKIANSKLGHPLNLDVLESDQGYLLLAHDGCQFGLGMMLWARRWSPALIFGAVGLFAVLAKSHAMALAPFWIAGGLWLAAALSVFGSIIWNDILWDSLGRWSRQIRYIGLATYPLYLIHLQVGRVAMLKVSNPVLAFTFGMTVVILIAFAVLPLEAWIRNALRAARGPESASLP